MKRWIVRVFAVVVGVFLLAGCSDLPRDPDGTLERVRSTGVLRAGASGSEGAVVVKDGRVSGPEADLVEGFADSLGVRVEWRPGGEQELVAAMEDGELDVLAAGFADDTPWADTVAVTRVYGAGEVGGDDVGRVLAVPLGENALLVALETYLDRATP